MDDTALLRAWQGGDPNAGDALVRRHFNTVWSFLRRRQPDMADDLTQRVFEACLAPARRFDGRSSFRTFLLGIANNKLLEHVRGHRREVTGRDKLTLEPSSPATSPSMVRLAKEHRKIVLRAMRALSIEHQIVLDLSYWQELGSSELAEVLDLRPGSVRSRLSRAREALVAQLRSMDINEAVRNATITRLQFPPSD